MKKLLALILLVGMGFISCEDEQEVEVAVEQEAAKEPIADYESVISKSPNGGIGVPGTPENSNQ